MNLPNFTEGDEGVFENLPDTDYRKAPGVSNSMLKHIAMEGDEPGSPAHFIQSFNDPTADSDALFFGRMVHSRILTPGVPLPGVVAIPETYPAPENCSAVKQKKCQAGDPLPWHGASNYCKDWLAAQSAAGIRPMSKTQLEDMDGVVNAIIENPICQVAFAEGKSEVSLFKRLHRKNGAILRKARLDWVPPGPALPDIKTCLDARKVEFDRVIWSRRYYVQAAYYLDLWNELNPHDQKTNFVFIAVEKFAPYNVQVFDVDQQDIEDGRREYQRNLALVLECLNAGKWPGYPTEIQCVKMRAPFNRKLLLPD